jgi:hypothetical protein
MLSFARVRALAVLTFLIVGALVSVGLALSRDSGQQEVQGCPPGWPTADLALREEREVRLNVFNGTGRDNFAAQISDTFANRDFDVLEHFDDADEEVEGVGLLRYGPAGVGSAQLVRAYFLDQVEVEFQLDREDDVVDVIIGEAFQQLATPTEVRQAIAQLGRPELPPNTCAPVE